MNAHFITLAQVFFEKLDKNGDNIVTLTEAEEFWKENFAKLNARAMFNEVDTDKDGERLLPTHHKTFKTILLTFCLFICV